MPNEYEMAQHELRLISTIERAESVLLSLCGTNDDVVLAQDDPNDQVGLDEKQLIRLEFRNGRLRVFDQRFDPFSESVAIHELPLPLQLRYGGLIPAFIDLAFARSRELSTLADEVTERIEKAIGANRSQPRKPKRGSSLSSRRLSPTRRA